MKQPTIILLVGVCILYVQHQGHCDSNLSKKKPSLTGHSTLKPLSIKTVIDCEFPAEHWTDSCESSEGTLQETTPEIETNAEPELPADLLLDFSQLYRHDDESFEFMLSQFAPTQATVSSKSEAYMEIAEELNLGFIKKGYKNVKSYEDNFSSNVEKSMSEATKFKVKFKSDVLRLRVTSTVNISEFHKIDLSAGREGQSVMYKVEIPMNKIDRLFNPDTLNPFKLPMGMLGMTQRILP